VIRPTPRIVIHTDPAFVVSINYRDLGIWGWMQFVHMDVSPPMTKSIYARIRDVWRVLRPRLNPIVFIMFNIDTSARYRLVESLGFMAVRDIPCTDGNPRRLFAHFA
jgi:hypothetical protein